MGAHHQSELYNRAEGVRQEAKDPLVVGEVKGLQQKVFYRHGRLAKEKGGWVSSW